MRILIVTGEASGDLHGANLAAAIRALRPGVEILGVGGPKMEAAGVKLILGIEGLTAIGMVGWTVLLRNIRTFVILARFLRRQSLDAVVFVDNPGLNLRLARVAKRAGHRVVYYIAPQIWAWHASRINVIKRAVDRMIVILPFERGLYERAGVRCDFVGHPLLDAVATSYDRSELRNRFGLDGPARVVGLLPGSREREVRDLLPVMLRAAETLVRTHQELQFVLAQAASVPDRLLQDLLAASGVGVRIVRDQPNEVMAASDLLFVASGTATLQAALVGTPMVILYRVSWLTYWIGRLLVRVQCIGLVNLVAGRKFVSELIQRDATPGRLCEEASRFLDDEQASREMCAELRRVREGLGEPGASRRAAAAVLSECL